MVKKKVNKTDIARQLGMSAAYVTNVFNGKTKPSERLLNGLESLGLNYYKLIYQAKKPVLSHARLPIPTLPRS